MTDQNQITIELLGNLIENIKAGNINVLERTGESIGKTAAVTIVFEGTPDKSLRQSHD